MLRSFIRYAMLVWKHVDEASKHCNYTVYPGRKKKIKKKKNFNYCTIKKEKKKRIHTHPYNIREDNLKNCMPIYVRPLVYIKSPHAGPK